MSSHRVGMSAKMFITALIMLKIDGRADLDTSLFP